MSLSICIGRSTTSIIGLIEFYGFLVNLFDVAIHVKYWTV